MKKGPRYFSKPASKPASFKPYSLDLSIEGQIHDGRGVAHNKGKTLFVEGALTGEQVSARVHSSRSRYDEAFCHKVLEPSPHRVDPLCPHYRLCGGCQLQHLDPDAQIELRQQLVLEQLQRLGGIRPDAISAALNGSPWHYRRRARLAVQWPKGQGEPLIGFRERRSKRICPIRQCLILDQRAEALIPKLAPTLLGLAGGRGITHLELAFGDNDAALLVRHVRPLTSQDTQTLGQLANSTGFELYLQPSANEVIHQRSGEHNGEDRLHFTLPDQELELAFHPSDFVQVNADINRQMVSQALDWLDLQADDRVLDLFCGLGNFTLPIARRVKQVVGVEGSDAMTQRAQENASRNRIDNAEFYRWDLTRDCRSASWYRQGFSKIVLDPPRAGAQEVIEHLSRLETKTILYISCDPATLARDASQLAAQGFTLARLGVMNMFPHTSHIESMALFIRR